jgi:uncharacterized coiled-coil protein SlyX
MIRSAKFISFRTACNIIALVLFGVFFVLGGPLLVSAQTLNTNFSAADIASVTETRIVPGSSSFGFRGVTEITINLKTGRTVKILSPYSVLSTHKEVFERRGYTGTVLQLVALTDLVKSESAQISSVTNTTNTLKPVFRIKGENLDNSFINIYSQEEGLRMTLHCVPDANKIWLCAPDSTAKNLSQNTNYLAAMIDSLGARSLQSFSITNNVIVRHNKLMPVELKTRPFDGRTYSVSQIDSIAISSQDPITFTIRARNEDSLRVGILREDKMTVRDDTHLLKKNTNGVFTYTLDKNLFNDERKYTFYVYGTFDGRYPKIYKTYEMVKIDGKLQLTSEREIIPDSEPITEPIATSTVKKFDASDISLVYIADFRFATLVFGKLYVRLQDGTDFNRYTNKARVSAAELKAMGFTGTLDDFRKLEKIIPIKDFDAEVAKVRKTPVKPQTTSTSTKPVVPVVPVSPLVPDSNELLPSVPTTISGKGCVIGIGSRTCAGTLTWNIDKKATTPRIENRFTGKFVSTGKHTQKNFRVTLTPGATMFAPRNGNTALGSVMLFAECAPGSASNGTVCAPKGTASSTDVQPPKPIEKPKPVVKPEKVLPRCTVTIEGRRAVLIGEEFKVGWESTNAEKIEFKSSDALGIKSSTSTLPLQGEMIFKPTAAGQFSVKMFSTSKTDHIAECVRTITVLNAENNGVTTTNQDIIVAGLRARISQQTLGINKSENVIAEHNAKITQQRTTIATLEANLAKTISANMASTTKAKAVADLRARISQQKQSISAIETAIAERRAVILEYRANITKLEADIAKIKGTAGIPAVRGASTSINDQMHSTLNAILSYLKTY